MRVGFRAACVCLMGAAGVLTTQASIINFYYTTTGSPDVFASAYNTATNAVGPTTAIGFSQQGADGILPGPTVGGTPTLFVAGELGQNLFQIPITGGAVVTPFGSAGVNAFLLSENPQGTLLFTENNAGVISTLPVAGGVISGNGTQHTVTGPDTNVSQLVWGMQPVGPVYYVTGGPGTNGNLGTINVTTFVTTQLFTNLAFAQDAVFDPFTGLIVLFGEGKISTLNPVTNALSATTLTLPGSCATPSSLFTTGAVDGTGHALIASCNQLFYVDYSGGSHNITAGAVQNTELIGAKDIALFPNVPVPEPATMAFTFGGLVLLGLSRLRIQRRTRTARAA